MRNVDFTQIELCNLVTHRIGNKLREERYSFSEEESEIGTDTKSFLLKYFLLPLKTDEFFSFSHSVDIERNDVYTIVQQIFKQRDSLIANSQNIGKLLYEQSMHPKIKEGNLNVAYFSNVIVEDEVIDAIGIFKSEKDTPFIKMNSTFNNYSIIHEYGFDIKGIDKGCIILNTDEPNGYQILIIDKTNTAVEAQYWKDDFLKVSPVKDEFNQTNNFLGLTKQFLTKQITNDIDISKSEQIDLLNKSVDYFKTHDSFDKADFEKEVLSDDKVIESFRSFDETYRTENEIEITDKFEISPKAVKKQVRAFKRVLKLDENFDILIKGDKDLIEKGIEEDGRKYYKIYYDEEK